MPKTATPKSSSREARRSGKRKSPRAVAEAELARGAITDRQFHAARARVYARECGVVWADDVWNGHDRDYAAEQQLREKGRAEPRVFTGSGPFKKRCACCKRDVPPQHCPGKTCDECRFEGAGDFLLHNTAGSSHRQLIGADA